MRYGFNVTRAMKRMREEKELAGRFLELKDKSVSWGCPGDVTARQWYDLAARSLALWSGAVRRAARREFANY